MKCLTISLDNAFKEAIKELRVGLVGLVAEPFGDAVVDLVELLPRQGLDLFVHVFERLRASAAAAGAELGPAVRNHRGRRDFQTFKFVLE